MRRLSMLAIASLAFAESLPPVEPAFSASPQSLERAFAAFDPGSNQATVLLEEARFDFDASGRETYYFRTIFKVWTKAGAESRGIIQQNWAPWQVERPSVRARVIGPSGAVYELDPKTIADAPVHDRDAGVFSDRRQVRAPLPALEAGSIVEEEIVTRQITVPLGAGSVNCFRFGGADPVEHTRVEIRAPFAIPLRFRTRLLPDAVASDRQHDGMREIVVQNGPMKPVENALPLLPSDEPRTPHIAFSTGRDWNQIAAAYAAAVEAQLAGFDAAAYLPRFEPAATRESKLLAILGKLNREIRYTGVEFSEASLVPRRPAEVLERKYGDCKDKSTLAVALLRAAGIEAHVALVYSSTGEDIEPDLPGIDVFNHAVVYVPGEPALWLDPTDPDLRLGVLPPENQGRLALIARPGATALVRTPELTAEDNRVIETREFRLSELGRAKVTETSKTYGTADRGYRAQFGGFDQKTLRDGLQEYVESTYGQAKIANVILSDHSDLTQPFELKIEIEDAQRGASARTEAAVAILISQITQRLPEYFREDAAPQKDDGKPAPPPRTQDLAIPDPFTHIWRYSILAPPGFRLRQLPEASAEKLGPATLTTNFTRLSDTAVTAEFRMVLPTRRFSAAQGQALREAARELGERKPILVCFDEIGETDLASGKVKEALAEFAGLRKLHPLEALHVMQTARALLAAGAGESARIEARRAVTMEPESASVYVQLAEVLKHDLVGRPLESGFDRDGAASAYRRALELNPDDSETRANLAVLLEFDRDGVRYGAGAKLADAIAEYRKILDKLPALGAAENYPIALLRAARARELREYLAKQPDTETNQALLVCAEGLLNGPAAAIRQAGVSGTQARQRVLASAGHNFILMRRYDLAAAAFDAAAAGSQNPAAIANLVQILRRTRRIEAPLTVQQPEDAVRALFARATGSGQIENQEHLEFRRAVDASLAQIGVVDASPEVSFDLLQSAIQYSREGSDETGWVIRMSSPGAGGPEGQHQVWFLNREEGRYRILAAPGDYQGTARLVLKLVDSGRSEQARIWLDRIRQELPAGRGDDPISEPAFARVWQAGQKADAPAMRRAAAVLLTQDATHIEPVIALLESASATQDADAPSRQAVAASLAEACFTARRYSKALALSEHILARVPHSGTALALAMRAAYAAGGRKEADRVAGAHLDRFQSDVEALRAVASVAIEFGDTGRSQALEKQIVDSGRGESRDYDRIAWADLMAGSVSPATLQLANRGMLLGGNQSTATMQTLAAVNAELGQAADARTTLLQRMNALGSVEPDDNDWYVFGRIAEQYGLTEDAAAMYGNVARPPSDLAVAASSYGLAQKRLRALGKNVGR